MQITPNDSCWHHSLGCGSRGRAVHPTTRRSSGWSPDSVPVTEPVTSFNTQDGKEARVDPFAEWAQKCFQLCSRITVLIWAINVLSSNKVFLFTELMSNKIIWWTWVSLQTWPLKLTVLFCFFTTLGINKRVNNNNTAENWQTLARY